MFRTRFHTRMFYGGRVVRDVSWHADPETPQEAIGRRRRFGRTLLGPLLLLALVAVVFWRFGAEIPRDYSPIEDHFKYGSVGTEAGHGVPYRIWKVLPEMFPEYLPDGGRGGYAALGFVQETAENGHPRDTPVGFSVRRIKGVERVSVNCASCHTATVRETPEGRPTVLLGAPAHQLDLLSYFGFLIQCAEDGRFNTNDLLARIEGQQGKLGPLERIIYQYAVPITKQEVARLKRPGHFLFEHPSGHGRIDTFTPYKALVFGFPDSKNFHVGNVDLPSIWNQGPREGMQLHWDGNNTSVHERNISAAIGAGATPTSLDFPRLKRIEDWLRTFPAPKYPFKIDRNVAQRGEPVYTKHCASCHGVLRDGKFLGEFVGQVEPIGKIKTDRERPDSYSLDLVQNQYTLGAGQDWRFNHFRKTGGYANLPLDGVWARAPFLHNGSVPTLRDLLEPPGKRPKTFYRGYDVYDQAKLGFVSIVPEEDGRHFTRYDTSVRGCGNGGHEYGTDLSDEDKQALVEFMKTL